MKPPKHWQDIIVVNTETPEIRKEVLAALDVISKKHGPATLTSITFKEPLVINGGCIKTIIKKGKS